MPPLTGRLPIPGGGGGGGGGWHNNNAWRRGDRVAANYDGRGAWHGAEVMRVNGDGTVDLRYDQGMNEAGVHSSQLRMEPVYPAFDEPADGGQEHMPSDLARERQALRQCEAEQQQHAQAQVREPARGGWISVGAHVDADYSGIGYFHPATVSCVHPDGTYELLYDDGLKEDRVPLQRIRWHGAPQQTPPPREPPSSLPPSQQC